MAYYKIVFRWHWDMPWPQAPRAPAADWRAVDG